MKKMLLIAAMAAGMLVHGGIDFSDAESTAKVYGEFTRYHYKVDGCTAWIVAPAKPVAGAKWVWGMEFPDAFKERTGVVELVKQGFYYVHIAVGNKYACPESMDHFNAFYWFLQGKGFNKKCATVGISRGGLYGLRFAIAHPERVWCCYGDAPVCDFKSWPGGKGKGKGSKGDWANLIKVYGFKDEAEAMAYTGNPVDNLKGLAEAKVPLIHVVGDVDDVVPRAENTDVVAQRYKALGGTIHIFNKPTCNHHPHGLEDPSPVVALIKKYSEVK